MHSLMPEILASPEIGLREKLKYARGLGQYSASSLRDLQENPPKESRTRRAVQDPRFRDWALVYIHDVGVRPVRSSVGIEIETISGIECQLFTVSDDDRSQDVPWPLHGSQRTYSEAVLQDGIGLEDSLQCTVRYCLVDGRTRIYDVLPMRNSGRIRPVRVSALTRHRPRSLTWSLA